jgi:asparagine synthase (glutamine-hydrolysing)
MPGHGEPYFVVLPDCEAALAVAAALPTAEVRTVSYASGRPWLVGRWSDHEVVWAAAGDARIAVAGTCPVDRTRLTREAERLRDLAGLDRLARTLPGSFHLIATLPGQVRVQGSAAGLRLVFHTRLDGMTVAADRADVLAALTDASLDEQQVAVRLLWPVPHPLLNTPLWRGIQAVDPEHYMVVADRGRGTRTSRWWALPEQVRSLTEGAPLVRDALVEAVAARTRGGGVVSSDLSGGLDSTSVCFLAAGSGARVIASTWPGCDPASHDLAWARRAAAHLDGVEHVVWPAEDSPLVYAGLQDIDDPLDEPTIGMMDRARALAHLPGLAAKGSRLHLTGIGGDHVAWSSEAYYHRLLRRRPWVAVGRLRGFRALFTWPLGATVRALADGRSYRRWLADAATDLSGPMPPPVTSALGWGMPPRLFDWVTAAAREAARAAIAEAARTAEPLAPDRGTHADLEQIRGCTRIVRQWDQMAARVGLPTASPFLDDRVIEACLAVRPEDRVTPWRYKPLLTAAMRDVVPAECLERTNKDQAAMDARAGLRRHRADLVALWADSRLARMGLVDPARLTALAQQPDTPDLGKAILYSTIGCEVWLRSRERNRAELPVTAARP